MRTKSLQWTALIISALSLFCSISAHTIRRKRKYLHVDGGKSRSERGQYFYRQGSLFEMPGLLEKRQLKGQSKSQDKRSRTGDHSTNLGTSLTTTGTYEFHVSPDQSDYWTVTNLELEDFFQVLEAQSYPPNSQPTKSPNKNPNNPTPTQQASTPQPAAPDPTREPDPAPTRAPTPQPTERPTPRPTRNPTPEPTQESSNPLIPPSGSPGTACEDMTRRDALMMTAEQVTDRATLMDPSTPQAQAYLWLLDDDGAQIDPCSYPTPLQRYILVTFYFATGGESWETSNGWLSADGECIWQGLNCNGSGGVTRLELRKSIPIPHSVRFSLRTYANFFLRMITQERTAWMAGCRQSFAICLPYDAWICQGTHSEGN